MDDTRRRFRIGLILVCAGTLPMLFLSSYVLGKGTFRSVFGLSFLAAMVVSGIGLIYTNRAGFPREGRMRWSNWTAVVFFAFLGLMMTWNFVHGLVVALQSFNFTLQYVWVIVNVIGASTLILAS